jgi:hypothetical protein
MYACQGEFWIAATYCRFLVFTPKKGSELFICQWSIIPWSTSRPNRHVQLQPLAQSLMPSTLAQRQARLVAATDGGQLRIVRCLVDIGRPPPQSRRTLHRQCLVAFDAIQQGVAFAKTVRLETAPKRKIVLPPFFVRPLHHLLSFCIIFTIRRISGFLPDFLRVRTRWCVSSRRQPIVR